MNNINLNGFRFYSARFGQKPSIERITLASAYRPTLTIGAGSVFVNLRVGDPIIRLSTGYADICAGHESDTPSTRCLGIIVGFGPMYDGAKMDFRSFYPNAGITYGTNFERQTEVFYIPAESALFEIDADENTTATTYDAYRAFKGENTKHIFTNHANNETATKLDISEHATTATFPWRIENVILNDPNNRDFSGTGVKLIVSCNVPQTGVGSATGI